MPNQRATNKKTLALWIDKKLLTAFKEATQKEGSNMSEILTSFIISYLQKSKTKHKS